jgi:enhancing lycopene biosynthesis protein 2
MAKVAVILAGSGRADGSEIHESVSVLIHLSRLGADYACFAPDLPQPEVVDHLTGKPAPGEKRNMLVEAARIARGDISPLSTLDVDAFDAVILPGGFGAAKNLCTFAKDGPSCTVLPDVERLLKGFHGRRKPIGLCCIAPVIAAKVFGRAAGGSGCAVTIGDDAATAKAIEKMGSTNIPKRVTESYTDEPNRIVTTPAYMCDAKPHEVFEGIGRLVERLVEMTGGRRADSRV